MDQAITLQEGKENSVLGRAVVVHGKIKIIQMVSRFGLSNRMFYTASNKHTKRK